MDGAEVFSECLAQATRVVKQVRPDHMANPTPDNDQNVRELLLHMLQTVDSLPSGLDEEMDTPTELDADLLEDIDLSIHWQEVADAAESVIDEIDLEDSITIEGEEIPLDTYLLQIAGDMLIHAWDLGKAIGVPVRITHDLAEAVYTQTLQRQLNKDGILGQPFDVPANTSIQTKLLALFGRHSDWHAPAQS